MTRREIIEEAIQWVEKKSQELSHDELIVLIRHFPRVVALEAAKAHQLIARRRLNVDERRALVAMYERYINEHFDITALIEPYQRRIKEGGDIRCKKYKDNCNP